MFVRRLFGILTISAALASPNAHAASFGPNSPEALAMATCMAGNAERVFSTAAASSPASMPSLDDRLALAEFVLVQACETATDAYTDRCKAGGVQPGICFASVLAATDSLMKSFKRRHAN